MKKVTSFFVFFFLMIAANFAFANASLLDVTIEANQKTYQCERSVELKVVFFSQYAVMYIDGHLITLKKLQDSDQNPKYISVNEQEGYRLQIKKDTAIVSWLPAEDRANEEVLLKACAIPEEDEN